FGQAREEYARLPPGHQAHATIKDVMRRGDEAAALGLGLSGDMQAAREMSQAAIPFDPSSPNGWTLLGITMPDGPEKAAAFKKAVQLGGQSYLPFYYLTYHAVKGGEFREALGWSQQALERGERQDGEVKSLLYQWKAISLAHLNAPR